METTRKIELVEVSKIIPYVNNARTHSSEQIKKLRASLREFGFVNPLLIDKELLGWLDVFLVGVEIELEGWINLFEHTKRN